MNHYSLPQNVVRALKQAWLWWKTALWCQFIKVILVLLDLSAAFGKVGHNVLLSSLKVMFGLPGKVLDGFDLIWNNAHRECAFMLFYLTLGFCYLVYQRVQLLVLWVLRCIVVLLGSLRSDVGLNITCILVTHSRIYISQDP